MSQQASAETSAQYPVPSNECLSHAARIAIVDDRPVMLDYWAPSHEGKVIIGVRESGEKLLVRSSEEYTSPVAKIYKVKDEYIVLTENSLYIISGQVESKHVS